MVDLKVYFHVIAKNKTESGGYLSKVRIQEQMKVLNDSFSETGITWSLANTTYTVNPEWFLYADYDIGVEKAMKSKLRQGGVADLNVYSVSFETSELSGFATFPWLYKARPLLDGVLLRYTVLPGGTRRSRGLGKTLVHEAGHWGGLLHTFEGGCDLDGDKVRDTPPTLETTDCNVDSDTCPQLRGKDPIYNYMSYSNDFCRTEFTLGQIHLLRSTLSRLRNIQF
ncbi:hypothetical protein AMATHDRAFT_67482 [Amanita thiersii Skay4041]|uniref:Peptidase M43 pregnancy-associated plasma-A domain-containing protein n=1 Tax=Amanita thiersii Skay4041 TaxID=703135 RepID=A0A2A9N9H6_9AGAR|nr:hypothetical protein AMATHDRAFT_67482 [Amanita thiersii Skay4041]